MADHGNETPLLSSLTDQQRNTIAGKIVVHNSWRYIGGCFETRYGWVINNDYLSANYVVHTDRDRSEALMKELAKRNITMAEFIAALKHDLVGLISTAVGLMKEYDVTEAEVQQAKQKLQQKPTVEINNPGQGGANAAEKALTGTLAYQLNDKLQHAYQYWCGRLGVRPATLTQKGYEIAELIGIVYNKTGKQGLHQFYELLKEDGEVVSVGLIDNSPASVLFK